jgi:peptide/nickel transport system permease protein
MKRLIAARLAQLIPTAFLISVVTFLLIHIIPGGPAEALAGLTGDSQSVAALNKQLGLDRPLLSQYLHWLGGVLHGQLGTSLQSGASVGTELFQRLPVTAELVIATVVLSAIIGIPVGVLAASRAQSRLDVIVRSVSGVGLAIPDFFLAMILVFLLAIDTQVFPRVGYVGLSQGVGQNLLHLALPIATLTLGALAVIVRQVRSAVLEELSAPYIIPAEALGIARRRIVWFYALAGATPTLLSVYGLLIAGLLGATVILEQLFVLPGLGSLLVNAVTIRDYPVLQAVVLVFAAVVLIVNFLADVLAALIDPRRKLQA